MKKIFTCFFSIFFMFLLIWPVNAINIIERSDWWADEDFRYTDTPYWADIFKKRVEKQSVAPTEAQKAAYAKQNRIDSYLVNNFFEDLAISDAQYYQGDNKLAWPIKKTNYVKAIVIHHTYTEYDSSLEWIQNIYQYHSLVNQWWDVGYNYLIGYDGEIFEWRAWGDYVVGAHAKNNNFSTVWISLIGNYEDNEVTQAQHEALSDLVKHLTKKYGIDLSKRFPMHKPCIPSDNCENGWDVKTTYHYPLTWHLDAGHTSCPWQYLYPKIEEIRQEHLEFTKGFTPISYEDSLKTLEDKYGKILSVLRKAESKKLIWLIAHINKTIKTESDTSYIGKLKKIRTLIFQVLRERW